MTPESSTPAPSRLLLVGDATWIEPFADAVASEPGTTVRTAPTEAHALEALRTRRPDAVVTEHRLPEGSGLDLLRAIRDRDPTLPVIVATASGSEAVASEAIAAGVSDYVRLDPDDDPVSKLLDRVTSAVEAARLDRARRDRARQFDAMFRDARTATWVLDADGSVDRMNRTAAELSGGRGGTDATVLADPEGTVVDSNESVVDSNEDVAVPIWELPRWSDSERVRSDVRRVVQTALDGGFGNAVVIRGSDRDDAGEREPGDDRGNGDGDDDDRAVIELSARPVTDERGELVSAVVEGVDITDHADVERDLRRSEELHRVTLNNMTDTVLITDEEGEYTYVCPNVHFIFGYTAEEIRELGTIDDLLGEDLFDRETLAEEGVLKNIECTVTDEAGREHTLLVNVREVSIRDGTLLYSCRDITKRKQRERALATLQETAREFLYAGTDAEIARHVTADTPDVLGLEAAAVYRFDPDANALRPVAYSDGMRAVHGPPSPVDADGETLVGHAFVEDERLFLDDVHADDRLADRSTDLRSVAFIPLGGNGVFVAGTTAVGAFDEVTRELADLLAATAEAAFDRIVREERLREQDRELQRRNDRLTALNRINETIREVDRALVRAETREEVEHAVCELLTGDDRFRFAWIGSTDATGETLTPRAWAGAERGYLDDQPVSVAADGVEPAGRTAATGEMSVVGNVPGGLREEEWRKAAVSRDYLSAISVPLVYNELTYGVLTVYAAEREAFSEMVREVFTELGETIASAISAIERKNALLTTSTTRVEFAVEDPTFLLSRLARDASCTVSYQGGARQTTEGSYVFVDVEGTTVESVAAVARDLLVVDSVREINATETGGVLRLRLSRPFLAEELADHGVVFHSASATPASTNVVVDVPEGVDVSRIGRLLEETFEETRLVSKRTRDRTAERDLHSRFLGDLTDRQLEVIQTAYYGGFFESPRERSGEEIAETLDISSSAFYQHARTVQRKLFSALFDERNADAADVADVAESP
ncbi:PAS domain S-box-containing protein [Halorubrum aquaticum]|uniref:PAS domain S-box-containing protein n=1 Tax=Halorubrum aquaticum TaxID=387340 RepID=A0A1I3BQA2_9EURY|nr:bacterio-opsin activator domain-containing protein [Halorubrum aquaticum]SFH64504.1 PAS domain S-box-containing protein [Halorubrum aquaticum]